MRIHQQGCEKETKSRTFRNCSRERKHEFLTINFIIIHESSVVLRSVPIYATPVSRNLTPKVTIFPDAQNLFKCF